MKYIINNSHMITRPLNSLFFKITLAQSTATIGLKNPTQKFFFRAAITGVGAVAPFPFVVVVIGAGSFNSKPGLSAPSVPLLTVPLVDCSLLWSTSFNTN